eukprot:scaffold171110_cov33-Prasinocladus_malaysianus.AAC.1
MDRWMDGWNGMECNGILTWNGTYKAIGTYEIVRATSRAVLHSNQRVAGSCPVEHIQKEAKVAGLGSDQVE